MYLSGMETLLTVAFFLVPYLLGSISAAVIISRGLYRKDIRNLGSNNAGSTNMFRELGLKAGVLTQVIDIGKGSLAAAIPYFLLWWLPQYPHSLSHLDMEFQSILAGMMAVIGHIYPVYFGFRGGKGINTLLGMMLVTNWLAALICIIAWVLILYLTRYVAIASMGGVLTYPIFLVVFAVMQSEDPNWLLTAGGCGMFLLVVYTHRSNIARLRKGLEDKNPWFEGRVQ